MNTTLDARPLPQPVNALHYIAQQFQGATYPNEQMLQQAQVMRDWLVAAGRAVPVMTQDPLMAHMLARLALSAEDRSAVRKAVEELEKFGAAHGQVGAAGGAKMQPVTI